MVLFVKWERKKGTPKGKIGIDKGVLRYYLCSEIEPKI